MFHIVLTFHIVLMFHVANHPSFFGRVNVSQVLLRTDPVNEIKPNKAKLKLSREAAPGASVSRPHRTASVVGALPRLV